MFGNFQTTVEFDDNALPRNERELRYYNEEYWANLTEKTSRDDDFTSSYQPAADVSVDAVVTSILLNSIAFVVLMATYECLRRLLPAVYSSRVKRRFKAGAIDPDDELPESEISDSVHPYRRSESLGSLDQSLPDVISLNWVASVFSVSWQTIRRSSGLDGYFFLRYIRMNLRICAVTSIWALLILVPVYSTGANQNGEEGWYHFSVANVAKGSWRFWVPTIFAYFLTGFIFFVMKQEYRHFLELRMDFLARGTSHVHPQHHYSLLVENIPHDLRSEKALYDYFDQLFPGKVHSASIVLNLPDLESVKARCLRVCRRLEKSIAHYHATGSRPTHIVGSPRVNILGIDLAPFDWSCGSYPDVAYLDNRDENLRPPRGTHIDSISYYTYDLAALNREMYFMQQRKAELALRGSDSSDADNWLARLLVSANEIADQIMIDSAEDNALRTTYRNFDEYGVSIPQAELMSSRYGAVGGRVGMSPRTAQCRPYTNSFDRSNNEASGSTRDIEDPCLKSDEKAPPPPPKPPSQEKLIDYGVEKKKKRRYREPGTTYEKSLIRRFAGRIGLDFVVAGIKFANRQLDHAMESVAGATMSSTGFVTFLDLTSVTCAATTPLTSKPQVLDVSVAPEPRDIIWANAHVSAKTSDRNEKIVNFFLVVGVFFWIFPLAAIQAFAKADYIARIPGMEWILTSGGGKVSQFVNGYLPVVALLVLILILPVIFELVARKYEMRKTFSDVQRSMLGRYFYYQVVNIYITVTAGSLWRSLSDILDHPSNLLELLGESLPDMVGYFVALLVTKILGGLPIVFLRVGALCRMLLLRSLSSGAKLTQRELDEIYRPENVQYGWEFPSQLLVFMIVVTYAVICPIIIPVGLLYFCFSLVVYKKQVLYVYQPVYESGGAMFPDALQRALFGLVCGQLTLIGYLTTRGCYFQPIFLLPLPLGTIWGMSYFNRNYAEPSNKLSLERAREYDRVSELLREKASSLRGLHSGQAVEFGMEARRAQFDKNSYRQPVLTQKPMAPRPYRRGQVDPLTEECRVKLRQLKDYALMNDEADARSEEDNSDFDDHDSAYSSTYSNYSNQSSPKRR